jgi:surface antigen
MNSRNRTLVSALAITATLCWRAPAFADPPSYARQDTDQGREQDRRGDHDDRNGDHRTAQDYRNNRDADHGGDRNRDARPPYSERDGDRYRDARPPYADRDEDRGRDVRPPYYANNGERADPRYPRYPRYPAFPVRPVYPVYPVYPVRPVYPVYPVYPRVPVYYPYPVYEAPRVYHGYYGDPWRSDYGIASSGRCNTDAVLGVAGAVTGAVIGNSTAGPGNRGIATVIGAIAGGIIGTAVGGAIDNGDRACFGQALELAPVGRPVVWTNPRSRVEWQVVPVRDVSRECREFDVRRGYSGRYGSERVTACRRGPGEWMFRS